MAININETPDKRKTVLIIGINSFLGSSLAEFFRKDFRVVGTYNKQNFFLPGILTLPCNVIKKEEIQLVFYAFKPDIVLYCAGLTSLYDCNELPNTSDALNSTGLFHVSEIAPRYRAKVIYFSSQYVFAGLDKSYTEMDNPDFITQYGKSQASAEFYLEKSSLNYLIFRCCKFYGRGVSPSKLNFFELMQKNLKSGKNQGFDDFVAQGFLDVYFLAMVLKMCIDKNVSNRLIHFSTKDIMTNYEFAKLYCEIFNESDGLVSKGKWHFPVLKSTINEKKSDQLFFKLDILNLESLFKIKMPTIRESMLFTYKRFNGVEKTAKAGNKNQTDSEINFI